MENRRLDDMSEPSLFDPPDRGFGLPPQRRWMCTSVKAVNEERREILHAISSAAVDRAGDIVVPSGARIDRYMQNPVVMVNHSYEWPEDCIGKCVSVTVEDDRVYARTQFLDTPLADAAFKLAQAGVGGWSIGFKPITYEPIEDKKGRTKGFRFTEWELLEYSAVAIPMNQEITNVVQRSAIPSHFIPRFFTGWDLPASSDPGEETKAPPPIPPRILDEAIKATLRRLRRFEAGQLIRQEIKNHE